MKTTGMMCCFQVWNYWPLLCWMLTWQNWYSDSRVLHEMIRDVWLQFEEIDNIEIMVSTGLCYVSDVRIVYESSTQFLLGSSFLTLKMWHGYLIYPYLLAFDCLSWGYLNDCVFNWITVYWKGEDVYSQQNYCTTGRSSTHCHEKSAACSQIHSFWRNACFTLVSEMKLESA